MQRRTDIDIIDLGQGIRRLSEFELVNCYLVEGTERACLIDTGAGLADMAAVAKSLTDKPLTVLITHAHEDHLGGGVWFPEVHMSPADLPTAKMFFNPFVKMGFLHMQNNKRKSHGVPYRAAFQRDYRPKLLPLNEGDVFDLGGRVIETYATPGHSVGSLTFRDSLSGVLFTGDNVDPMVTLQFPYATSMEIWLRSAKKTLALAEGRPMYGGHGSIVITPEMLETVIGWGEEIVAKGNVFPRKTVVKRGENKLPCIVYKSHLVR